MLNKIVIFFLFLFFPFFQVWSQNDCLKTFQNEYSNADNNSGIDVITSAKGDIYVAGNSTSSSLGTLDIIISKYSSSGITIWSKKYGSLGNETVRRIKLTKDGGVLIIGQTTSFENAKGEILCFKIDASGTIIWQKKFSIMSNHGDLGMDIIETSDGGYALIGILNVFGGVADLIVMKLDNTLVVNWAKRFDRGDGEDGAGIVEAGNNLIVTCDLQNSGYDYDDLIMSIDKKTGDVVAVKKLNPDVRGMFVPKLYVNPTGGYLIEGHMINGNTYSEMHPVVLKLDAGFNILNSFEIIADNYTNDFYTGFYPLMDGFIGCASSQSEAIGYLYRVNDDGTIQIAKKTDEFSSKSLYGISTNGNQIIATGKKNTAGKSNLFLMGFGMDGFIDQQCHTDTAIFKINKPNFSVENFSWPTITSLFFSNTNAPLTTTDVSLNSSSVCDACPVTVVSSFSIPDTVCLNAPVKITNTSSNAASYYWNFCTADINQPPVGDNLGNPSNYMQRGVYIDYVSDNGKYYGFMTNNFPGKLIRLDFGNSLLNTPVVTDLGTVNGLIPPTMEGIQVVKNENKWYLIIVGGNTPDIESYIVTVEIGTQIDNNTPTGGINWGNLGGLAYPHDLYVFQDNANWYGLTVNTSNNTMTRFDFTTSFNNQPTALNLGNIGNLNAPTGLHAINDNGKWYVFVTNALNSTITRLDFGNSLLNNPTGFNLGNPGGSFHTIWDITILKYCDQITGYAINADQQYNNLLKLDFNGNITNTPSVNDFGNIGNMLFPHCLSKFFRVGPDVYSFVPNVENNTLTRLRFEGCTNASISNSVLQNPPAISYNKPGVYNINLTVDDGLPTQSSFCRQITVLPYPDKQPLLDTSFCKGDSIVLSVSQSSGTYSWNTGSKSSSITVNNESIYWVDINYYGCTVRDSISTKLKSIPVIDLGKDTALCIGDTLMLQPGENYSNYLWQDGSVTSTFNVKQNGLYIVKVTNSDKCSITDSIVIRQNFSPVINLADTTICYGQTAQLNAQSLGNNTYQWQASSSLSSLNVYNPLASPSDTTFYKVTVTNEFKCSASDSLMVAVVPFPQLQVMNDTAVCSGSNFTLSAFGTDITRYEWVPPNNLTSPDQPITQGVLGNNTVKYTLTGFNDGCSLSKQVNVAVLPAPLISLAYKDTTICIGGSAQLRINSNDNYTWSPAIAIDNVNSAFPVVRPLNSQWYTVTATNANNCVTKDSVNVIVTPAPVFDINPKQSNICIGDKIPVTASGGDIYTWSPATTVEQTDIASTKVFPTTTTTYFVAITNNRCHVTDTLSTIVSVSLKPDVSISKSNDIDCFINTARLEAKGGITYNWLPSATLSFSNGAVAVARPLETTTYYVEVSKNGNCKTLDSVQVKVIKDGAENGYLVPSAFTPNGDLVNDCFGIKNWGPVTSFELTIFDRWGQKVFITTDPFNCWNGQYKNIPQPPGTFVYQIRAKTLCGNVYRKGTLVLLR